MRLSTFFHVTFCAILLGQVVIGWFSLFQARASAAATQRIVRHSIDEFAAALSRPDLLPLLKEGLNDVGPLHIQSINSPPQSAVTPPTNFDGDQNDDWDGLRHCRHTFVAQDLLPLDLCVARLSDSSPWAARAPGDFLYLTVSLEGRPTRFHESGDVAASNVDQIRLVLRDGSGYELRLALVYELARRSSKPAIRLIPYVADANWALGRSLKLGNRLSLCMLRLPPGETRRTIAICRLAASDLGRSTASLAAIAGLKVQVEVYRSTDVGPATLVAASVGNGEDIAGSRLDSLNPILLRGVQQNVSLSIYDENDRLHWRGEDPTTARKCGILCTASVAISRLAFPSALDEQRRQVGQFTVVGAYIPSEGAGLWLTNVMNVVSVVVPTMCVVLVAYILAMWRIVRPIQRLTEDVERASRSDAQCLETRLPRTRRDEIATLVMSVNTLLSRLAARTEQELMTLKMIGHDIRAPVQSLLAMVGPENEAMQRQVTRIYNAIVRFGETQGASGERSVQTQARIFDLAEFVETFVENAGRFQNIRHLSFNSVDHQVRISADPAALEDAIGHILNNAERYRPAGTPIMFRVGVARSIAVLDLENLGPPIACNRLEDIFDYGFTTRDGGDRNLGLGLYEARQFILGMGGELTAQNLERGVRFRIELPIVQA